MAASLTKQTRGRGEHATPAVLAPAKVSEEQCPQIVSTVDVELADLQDPATELEIACQFSPDGGQTWRDGSRSTYRGDPARTEPLVLGYSCHVVGGRGLHELPTRTLVRVRSAQCRFAASCDTRLVAAQEDTRATEGKA